MASSTSNVSDSNTQKRSSQAIDRAGETKTQRANERVLEKIRLQYPGGLDAFISDYRDERKTMRQLLSAVPLQYRAFMRAFSLLGVPMRDKSARMIVARKLNPAWNDNISRGKLREPFHHSPEVTASATEKRMKLFRADPSRHGQSHIGMSRREQTVKAMLDRYGVHGIFNQPAAGYFVDFYLPDLRIGIEVQRSQCLPDKLRCEAITQALSLRTMIYIPNIYFRTGNSGYIDSLIQTIAKDHETLAETIGDARFLCQKQAEVDARWYGFGFKRRWEHSMPRVGSDNQIILPVHSPSPALAARSDIPLSNRDPAQTAE